MALALDQSGRFWASQIELSWFAFRTRPYIDKMAWLQPKTLSTEESAHCVFEPRAGGRIVGVSDQPTFVGEVTDTQTPRPVQLCELIPTEPRVPLGLTRVRLRCGQPNQNRQNTPAVMFVWVDTPLPEKVRKPAIAGPVSVEAATAVTPSPNTGSDELVN